jgi:AraC-like DNA-binding protein
MRSIEKIDHSQRRLVPAKLASMTRLANGRIVLWEGGSLWIMDVDPPPGAPERTDFHAHHALQITLAFDGRFDLLIQDQRVPGPIVAVAPDVRHAFQPKGLIGILFAEPESPAGRALAGALLGGRPFAPLPRDLLAEQLAQTAAAFRGTDPDDAVFRDLGRRMTQILAGEAQAPAPDARIQGAIAWVADRLDRRLSVADVAAHVGLSVDRMSHLFVEQTGLAFRTWLLWRRLTKAVEAYAAGASLTEAAHEAGFADSAHLSRTFRRMFGVAAAELQLA